MRMKKKTKNVVEFIEGLHGFIVHNPQFREYTRDHNEKQIQTELRPLIIRYLEDYFRDRYQDPVAKANKEFYWEGEAGTFGEHRQKTFGSRNYPDFIIKNPYRLAIEYKQSASGSTVKHGIGQSRSIALMLVPLRRSDARVNSRKSGCSGRPHPIGFAERLCRIERDRR